MNKVNISKDLNSQQDIFTGDICYPGELEPVKLVFGEIFGDEQYKKGLEYIKTLEKPIVVDCGAHIGLASLYFNRAMNATIYSLEPVKENFEALSANVQETGNIHPVNIALRSYSGVSNIHLGAGPTSGSSFFNDKGDVEPVRHLTIEDFMNEYGVDHIDLLKIDTEGSEYEILLSQAFRRVEHRISMIIGEGHLQPLHPNIIPAALTNYDVTFSDEDNLVVDVSGTLPGETEPFLYRTLFRTMFTATRRV